MLNYKCAYIPVSLSRQIKEMNVAPNTCCVTILEYNPTANRYCLFRTSNFLNYTHLHGSPKQTLAIFNFHTLYFSWPLSKLYFYA